MFLQTAHKPLFNSQRVHSTDLMVKPWWASSHSSSKQLGSSISAFSQIQLQTHWQTKATVVPLFRHGTFIIQVCEEAAPAQHATDDNQPQNTEYHYYGSIYSSWVNVSVNRESKTFGFFCLHSPSAHCLWMTAPPAIHPY